MTASVRHATFTIERTHDASPTRVWRAWSDRDQKAAWFSSPAEWGPDEFELDTPEEREHGTRELLDALGRVLSREPATA